MKQFSQWMNDFWKSLRNVRYTFAHGNTKGVDETFSLSNQVCDNPWINETSVHTIIIYNMVRYRTLHSLSKVAVWFDKSQQLIFPQCQAFRYIFVKGNIHLQRYRKKLNHKTFFQLSEKTIFLHISPKRRVWDISMMFLHEQNMYFSIPITVVSK